MNLPSNDSNRLIALDALRGFTIAAMVIVNSPGSWGSVYAPLLHAHWHGITPTDVIFPFFLFMVGMSITLAYDKRLANGPPTADVYRKIISRSVKILLLGWFLALWPYFSFEGLRLVGVLPRIALVFLVCALLFLHTNWKQQIWIGALLLLAYWGLLALVPVPIDDVIRGALATGEVAASNGGTMAVGELRIISETLIAPNYQPGVNFAAWLDRIITPGSFWQVSWDPEGLTSTLPAIVTGIIGMLVGRLYSSISDPWKRLTWLFFTGFMLYLAGAMWGRGMPLNKQLWTSSYVLWTAGMATMGLAACYLVVDLLGYTRWTKIGLVYGANSITSFALAGMLLVVFYYPPWGLPSLSSWWMQALPSLGVSPKLASVSYAVLYMLVIYLPMWALYRRKIFIKV